MSDRPRSVTPRLRLPFAAVGTMVPRRGGLARLRAVAVRIGPGLAFLTLLILWVGAYLGRAVRDVTLFPGHEGDGPFQLFNPLRRIAAGQVGGVDFQYFHGIGLPYLHYPLFALAGGDLFAAELARAVVALAAFLGTTLAVCAALTRRLTPTLGLTAATAILVDQLGLYGLILAGNASLGVRSAVPFFILASFLAGFRPRVEAILIGVLAGAGLLFGVEHGVATLGMIGVVWGWRRLLGLAGGSLGWAGTVAALGILTTAAGLLAIGGPAGAVGALRYAFVEMPHDQFWYFGVPPNPFLYRWADIFTDRGLWLRALGPFALVGFVAVRRLRFHPADRPAAIAVLGLLAYGLLAIVAYFGYCSGHYLEPLTRVALVGGVVLGWRIWASLRTGAPGEVPIPPGVRWGIAVVVGALFLAGPSSHDPSSLADVSFHGRKLVAGVETIQSGGCQVTPKLQADFEKLVAAIDADRGKHGVTRPPVIWSTYAGRLEDHYGVFHPACDYAIHALGPVRRAAYFDTFRQLRPDYVITCRQSYFLYEEWLRNSTWELYEEVIQNYEVLVAGRLFAVWRRKSADWVDLDRAAGQESREPEGPDWFTVPAPPGSPADAPRVVEVEYEVSNPLASVPIIGRLPRYLLGPNKCQNNLPISLPPDRTTWSFPVFPHAGQTPTFFGKTFSLVGGQFTIKRIRIRPMNATPAQINAITG